MDVDDEPPSMDGPVASGDHRTHHQQSESTLKSVAEGDEGVEDGGDAVDATLDETYLPSNDSSTNLHDEGFDMGGAMRKTPSQLVIAQRASDRRLLQALTPAKRPGEFFGTGSSLPSANTTDAATPNPLFRLSLPLVRQTMQAVVDDSFNRCFESKHMERWNWGHLFIPYCIGVLIRYFILFPIRLAILLGGVLGLLLIFFFVKLAPLKSSFKAKCERKLIRLICGVFVLSWSGVIKVHGVRPAAPKGQSPGVFVANHSSMIDFIILQQSHCYAVVGQQHTGWVRFFQNHVLSSMQCVWFNRGESSNRALVAQKLSDHAKDGSRIPLLVFPEGTCVNNEYVVQFKKGVFELGVPVCPIAIKYNKVFVDGYWNSRKMSFGMHLFRLMTSWCVVVDVWFMDPQRQAPGEDPVQFAGRVQRLIARRAGLEAVDWDGYMKYWKPSDRFIQSRQEAIGKELLVEFGLSEPSTDADNDIPRQSSDSVAGLRKRVLAQGAMKLVGMGVGQTPLRRAQSST